MGDEKTRTNWSLVLFFVAIALILINFTALWLTTRELSVGTEIVYWQKFNGYLSGVWYLSCLLVPIVLGIWAKIGIRKFQSAMIWFLLSVALLFICAFADYSALFVLKFVDHVGSAELKGSVYQLAKVANYDNGTTYYFGRCDKSGYRCVFHDIYTHPSDSVYVPETVEITEDHLQLMINGEIVYGFDGASENCFNVERFYGYCLLNIP